MEKQFKEKTKIRLLEMRALYQGNEGIRLWKTNEELRISLNSVPFQTVVNITNHRTNNTVYIKTPLHKTSEALRRANERTVIMRWRFLTLS